MRENDMADDGRAPQEAAFAARTLEEWRRLARAELKGRPLEALDWLTPRGSASNRFIPRRISRALRPRASRWPARCLDLRPICVARGRRCTPTGRGRSGNMPAFRPPRNQTAFSATI